MTEIPVASDRQSAIRLLACLVAASTPVADGRWGDNVTAVLRSQSRLQALDFWMRNPDYLADEVLTEFERSGNDALLNLAQEILEARESDLRRLPMVRFLFGAFEPIDNPLAILRSVGFVRVHRDGVPGQVREHLYLLTRRGQEAMGQLASAAPELAWYQNRALVVARLAGDTGGAALKARQYQQAEYASTSLKHVIAPITERVRGRLADILGGQEVQR